MTTMEVKSISCKGVKSGIPFQKPSLYAVVSVARAGDRKHNQRPEQKKTPVDRTGGENPEWDRPMQLDIDGRRERDLLLEFAIKTDSIFGDRVVGKVGVPVSDLVVTAGALRQVSYQVRSPDGKPNGVLSFFYKMGDLTSTPPPPAPDWGTLYPPPPSTAAPPADVYPPPPPSTVSDLGCYPTPDPAVAYPPPAKSGFGYFSMPNPVGSIPFPWSAAEYCYPPPDMGYVYPTGGGGYYPPPPPPPPVNVVVYPPPPPPAPACCYPVPLVPNWYRPDRGLYGCN